jgi:predicted GNAT family acetyltransferase
LVSEQIAVRKAEGRFEVTVDDTVAGFTEFFEHEGKRVFYHTEVGEEWGGRGLGKILASGALDQTRADGLRIVAICPFIKAFLSKTDAYNDIVDPVSHDIAAFYKANYQV